MRPLTEIVDGFIEAYFNGSIVTFYQDQDLEKLPLIYGGKEAVTKVADWIAKLNSEKIPEYLNSSQDQKGQKALELILWVITLRSLGALANNPHTLKELEYWKARASELEKENEKLHKQVTDAYSLVDTYQAQIEDLKKGRREVGTN